jgi:hypothetical protein
LQGQGAFETGLVSIVTERAIRSKKTTMTSVPPLPPPQKASVLQEGLPALHPKVQRFASNLVSWSKLKVARAVTQLRHADALESEIAAIHRQWSTTNPDFARRSANKLSGMARRFTNTPLFGVFNNVNIQGLGTIDAIDLMPAPMAPDEIGDIVASLTESKVVAKPAVLPESTNTVLRLRTKTLRCLKETNELSSSDEIVWSTTWVTPTGNSGYQWWRRVDFDKGETKSIANVFTFPVPQKFPHQFSFIFCMLEEDSSNAAKVVERTWAKLKERLEQKIDEFSRQLAAEIGFAELGPIIASILKWVTKTVIGWLISVLAPDPMGTLAYTITLNGGTTWIATGNATLPLTITHKGSGGHYTADLQFELA